MRLKRLETLADLWGKVYMFHPAIVSARVQSPFSATESGDSPVIDWNQVLIRVIPKVEAAQTPDDLAKAINEELLQPLEDPLTFASTRRDQEIEGSRDRVAEGGFEARLLTDSIGYVRVPPPSSRGPGFLIDFQAAVDALGAVEKLVVDLRWPVAPGVRMNDPILRFFVRTALLTGPVMNRVHEGWSEDNGLGAYRQKWEVIGGAGLHPLQEADWYLAALCPGTDFTRLKTITTPTVFLVNRPSAVSYHKVLDALQSQPGIAVVLESSGPPEEAPPLRLEYPEGLVVQLNTERLVGHGGNAGFCPDLVVDKAISQTQLAEVAEQALLKASSPKPQASSSESAARLMNLMLPAPLSETGGSLTREERLLGLFKVWNVIRYLYPHLEFCDMDWHGCLLEWIPRIEETDSPVAYVRALRMLTAHLHDNNIFYYFPGLPEPQALPVGFGWVEGKIVVTDVLGSGRSQKLEARSQKSEVETPGGLGSAAEDSSAVSGRPSAVGLAIGDELVEFDGKTVTELIAEHRLQFSYSTEGAFYRHMAEMMGFGTAGAEVKLVFRRGEQPISLTLKRTVTREAWVAHLARKRQSRGYRLLEGNLGYLDLGRLSSLEEFDHAFEVLRQANGLIIDIRGYPGFMVQLALSARLSERPVKSAIFEIPVVSGFARLEQGWNAGQYEVQPDPKKHYRGPVVVLINEKTFGGSEDICIYLKNAGRVIFVGGTTAGCNGNRTWLSLPGGGRLWFTGMRVKFGDGSRFQNVGIVPDVPVAPTVEGIRAGRDEVLEKGIEVLRRLVHRPSSPESPQTKDEQTKDEGQGDKGRRTR
ncbi:MAG: S41 family peptidase [candidate division WOR-3 bacterium]|nr:S41 family peptidase [candidate division WOR-3 bacterium]